MSEASREREREREREKEREKKRERKRERGRERRRAGRARRACSCMRGDEAARARGGRYRAAEARQWWWWWCCCWQPVGVRRGAYRRVGPLLGFPRVAIFHRPSPRLLVAHAGQALRRGLQRGGRRRLLAERLLLLLLLLLGLAVACAQRWQARLSSRRRHGERPRRSPAAPAATLRKHEQKASPAERVQPSCRRAGPEGAALQRCSRV